MGPPHLYGCRDLWQVVHSEHNAKHPACVHQCTPKAKLSSQACLVLTCASLLQELVNTLVSRRTERESIDLRDREIERQWRHLALVLDRIFFCMYLVIIIISLVIFFPREQRAT